LAPLSKPSELYSETYEIQRLLIENPFPAREEASVLFRIVVAQRTWGSYSY